MSLIKLAKEAYPDAWEVRGALPKAKAVENVVVVLEALRHQYGSGQVEAVIRGLLRDD